MALTPKFEGPDGVLREKFIFSTTIASRFFVGTMDPQTVDMQVSVRGGAYTSNPDLIYFEDDEFIVPNPSAYPDGLDLLPGDNEILVKAVLANGQVTPSASILARLVKDRDLGNAVSPPSGVSIERYNRNVVITVDGLDDDDVIGYHFYASTQPGGGTSGYSRINPSMVISGRLVEVFEDLAEVTVDAAVATLDDGSKAADPLYLTFTGTQQDSDSEVLQTDFNEAFEVPETVDRVRTTVTVESVRTVRRYQFVHDRQSSFNSTTNPAIPNASFNTIPTSDPLYYVVTAVYFVDGEEFESSFSPEVSGAPLLLAPTTSPFPTVSRQQIVRDVVLSIFRSQPQLDVKPGSVVRDTFIDPFSTEADRLRFVIEFLHAAQSFSTLLPIDDPTFSGQSIPVAQSPYKMALKQAFFLQSDAAVQNLIDATFEKLASNFGKQRESGRRARGEALVYTKTKPTTSIQIALGSVLIIGGVRFRATSSGTISPSGSGSFYNPATGRYSTRVFIQAEEPGLRGNLASGLGGRIEGNLLDVQVLLESPTIGGTNDESNRDLATRVSRALSSVDTGTVQGYTQSAVDVPGVNQANVVEAGHPLMQRDRTPEGRHVGGKVDIWVRGENLASVTDAFAFSYEIVKRGQFEPFGDPQDLKFRAVNPALTPDNPIIEVLDFPEYGFEFRNDTTLHTFDLTDVQVVDYNIIQLSSEYNDQAHFSIVDAISGSYRYRTSNKHVFTRQPVREITRFEGESSGVITPSAYALYHGDSPLDVGRSNEARDYLKVDHPEVLPSGVTIPSSTPISVTNEQHVILDGIEYLDRLGANPLTVKVWNKIKSVRYDGPYDSDTPDYDIIDDGVLRPLGIKLRQGSNIKEGEEVLIDYSHDENFSVEYVTNALVGIAQNSIEDMRHVTADVLVKEAIPVEVDITATVVLQARSDRQVSANQVDSMVRTSLSRLFGSLGLGEPIRQSDVAGAIDAVPGVSYVVLPLSKLTRGKGSLVVREALTVAQEVDYVKVSDWSSSTVSLFLLTNPLEWGTSHGGGPVNEFRGVFQDKVRLAHLDSAPNINGFPLRNKTGQAFIIGSEGMVVPGYSDDETLTARYGLTLAADLAAKRREITANRVLVTLVPSDVPTNHTYAASYVVGESEGVQNVVPGPAEYLTLGNIELTYDEDQNFLARIKGRRS